MTDSNYYFLSPAFSLREYRTIQKVVHSLMSILLLGLCHSMLINDTKRLAWESVLYILGNFTSQVTLYQALLSNCQFLTPWIRNMYLDHTFLALDSNKGDFKISHKIQEV
jgi:hypothetical protein